MSAEEVVNVEEIKAFLRIEHDLENDLLLAFRDTAVEWCKGFANHDGATVGKASFKQAVLLLVSHFYQNREAISTSNTIPRELPLGVRSLLWIERKMPI